MSKKQVVEVQCDRCPRKEYIDPETTKTQGPTTIVFAGRTITFTDLCSSCFKAVSAHVDGIAKHLEGKSPDRKVTDKKQKATAPSVPETSHPPTKSLSQPETVVRSVQHVRGS